MSTEPCGTEWDDPVTDDAHMCKVIGEHDLHECQCGTVQFTTPPGPRVWSLPAEPGPEVTAVRDPRGRRYEPTSERYRDGRRKWRYWHVDTEGWATVGWDVMVANYGPLTDATGEPA